MLTIDYPNLGFNNTQSRTSPQVRNNLGISLNPYKSYTLVVDCSDYLNGNSLQANSIVVSMTVRSRLLERDSGETDVQNIPQGDDLSVAQQYGKAYTNPETLTVPAANAQIKAESSAADTGVQGSIEKIDAAVRSGLSGGYDRKSRRFGYETLLHDAGYQVIAVPMWGNGWYVGQGKIDTPLLPYINSAPPYNNAVVDRRIIPIHHSMVVHHVHCFLNYTGLNKPTTATYEYDIGVGIGCGIQSDSHSYRQVARLSFTAASKSFYQIDDFDGSGGFALGPDLKGSLMNVPLVGTAGVGYDLGGKPFYVGQANSMEETRSAAAEIVGGGSVTIPSIDGKEQWIEVRMLFRDSAGIDNMPAGEGLVGLGGHWVYIIGKRHVC